MPKPSKKPVEEGAEEMIQVKKSDLDKIVSRLAALENTSEIGAVTTDEPDTHTGRVKLYGGRPVSKVTDVIRTKKFENDGSEIMECTLHVVGVDGEINKFVADYLKFIREADEVTATITNINDTPVKITPKNEPKRIELVEVGDWSSKGTGRFVENRVIIHETTYEVKLPDGESVTLETLNL